MIFIDLYHSKPVTSKRVLLPGLLYKDLKPVSLLLKPSDIIIPMFFVSILAQISDNLKNLLEVKDIQNLFSVKVYRRILFSSFNSVSLSVIQAISKTLGPELETLCSLNISERVIFLKELQLKIMFDKNPGKIDFRERNLHNPSQLMKHRKGLSIQFRSIMLANSIFSPNSISIGSPVYAIDLDLILHSSKLIWLSLGLTEEEFQFILRKDALSKLKFLSQEFEFFSCSDDRSCLKTLIFFELKKFLGLNTYLDLGSDNVVLNGESNLVLLEKELGFLQRNLPNVPDDFFVADKKLEDSLLRVALQQRKQYKLSFQSLFTTNKVFNKKNSSLIKGIKLKKLLSET